jgi:ABC-type lipoprotein export system ATPase subunit
MIELRDLRFAYVEGDFGLQVERLSIAKGQRVGWIGPSGSGKTTLLHLVAGIVSPAAGLVETCGKELTALPDASRRDFRISNVGLVFQDFALLDYLSVLDNILLPYRINRSLHLEGIVRDRAQQLAEDVGLGEMLTRRPTKLSQGERQRVAVCRALVANPQLLLADEPTANLDPDNAARVLDILDGYATKQAATLVVVTHDRDVLTRFDETIDVSTFCSSAQSGPSGGGDNNA